MFREACWTGYAVFDNLDKYSTQRWTLAEYSEIDKYLKSYLHRPGQTQINRTKASNERAFKYRSSWKIFPSRKLILATRLNARSSRSRWSLLQYDWKLLSEWTVLLTRARHNTRRRRELGRWLTDARIFLDVFNQDRVPLEGEQGHWTLSGGTAWRGGQVLRHYWMGVRLVVVVELHLISVFGHCIADTSVAGRSITQPSLWTSMTHLTSWPSHSNRVKCEIQIMEVEGARSQLKRDLVRTIVSAPSYPRHVSQHH